LALIKSISGIRGTIGGKPGENLTPVDIIRFTAAFTELMMRKKGPSRIVVGRDGRISGQMVQVLVMQTLSSMGVRVIDAGLSTTPTVEMAVKLSRADAGIMITASHNPAEWNALKLLDRNGEFISAETGRHLLELAEKNEFSFAPVRKLGKIKKDDSFLQKHIKAILKHPLVHAKAVAHRKFKVVVDAINSTGALAVPALLDSLGVKKYTVLNGKLNGEFAHNPEPLPAHLKQLCREVKKRKADLGIAVDPDVDRLCFVCEDGKLFGEEFTLVAVADYVLQNKKGVTVSNLSSTKALQDITEKYGCRYFASAVGEVNVVKKMKEKNAVIGGEGNGGIIVPDLHYGRDALAGIALFLSYLAAHKKGMRSLRKTYPNYFISKNKIDLAAGMDIKTLFEKIRTKYHDKPLNTEDGLKINFDEGWVHLRSSNTEPIIRIYAESDSIKKADQLAERLKVDIASFK
jgi:phosphomannomutase